MMYDINTPISDIDITNDYMFAYVMRESDVCIELLNCLLPGKRIRSIRYLNAQETSDKIMPEIQKTLLANVDMHSVRLDAYLDDGETVYNIEMQTVSDRLLAKRARLYQAHIDVGQLERGQNYGKMKPSYVIFICKFDPFGYGQYRYSFENECKEVEGLKLEDGTYKLFFNTTGTRGDIDGRLKELLKYMNDAKTYPVEQTRDDLIKLIDGRVEESLKSKEWRAAYMTWQIYGQTAEMRGEERGIVIGEERGIVIGEERGKREQAIATARNMLEDGFSLEVISKYTGLSVSEIEALNT